jgi:hypothetical protein
LREPIDLQISPEMWEKLNALPDKIHGSKSRPWSKQDDDILIGFWNSKRQPDIAKILGRSVHACCRRIEELERAKAQD